MALHFDIKINNHIIGHVQIRRLNSVIIPKQPSSYTYEIEMYKESKSGSVTNRGRIEHLYENGAVSLIGMVMDDAKRRFEVLSPT